MQQISFWKDKEKKVIDPSLYSSRAEAFSKIIAQDVESAKNVNKRTQIRKFYDEVVRLDSTAKARQDEWDNILPLVHMLTAKAAYAKGRKLVSENFVQFIRTAVNQVETPGDLAVFAGFFEAFMGFYRMHGPDK